MPRGTTPVVSQPMITKLLRKANLTQLRSLLSPAFFDVVPRRVLWSQASRLYRNYRDREGFRQALQERRQTLREAELPVELEEQDSPADGQPQKPDQYAGRVVTLYFHQLLRGGAAILDLRARSLGDLADGGLCWHPDPLWTRWDPEFVSALQDVYGGFYAGRDERFRRGLAALGLEGAREAFERHFDEEVGSTTFDLQSFVDSFHDIFAFCRDHRIELPAGFLPLGICLATMYENLDRLSVTVDVRRCFESATTGAGDAAPSQRSLASTGGPAGPG